MFLSNFSRSSPFEMEMALRLITDILLETEGLLSILTSKALFASCILSDAFPLTLLLEDDTESKDSSSFLGIAKNSEIFGPNYTFCNVS